MWGTVCDDFFTDVAATVVCRQLNAGYSRGLAMHGAPYGRGRGPIWLDDVICLGTEARLWDCSALKPRGTNNCRHKEDVAVACFATRPPPPPAPPVPPAQPYAPDGTVRLVHGPRANLGRVEMSMFGRWGTLCGRSWNPATARVACRQLGLPGGSLLYGKQYQGSLQPPYPPIWLKGLRCTGSELNLLQCPYEAVLDYTCPPTVPVAITCTVPDGALRLAGGNKSSGRLEVFHDSTWGTVCSDDFGAVDAAVACRQLGFATGRVAPLQHFGPGKGRVWMEAVGCLGGEARLADCPFDGWQQSDCPHELDAGVICEAARPPSPLPPSPAPPYPPVTPSPPSYTGPKAPSPPAVYGLPPSPPPYYGGYGPAPPGYGAAPEYRHPPQPYGLYGPRQVPAYQPNIPYGYYAPPTYAAPGYAPPGHVYPGYGSPPLADEDNGSPIDTTHRRQLA